MGQEGNRPWKKIQILKRQDIDFKVIATNVFKKTEDKNEEFIKTQIYKNEQNRYFKTF